MDRAPLATPAPFQREGGRERVPPSVSVTRKAPRRRIIPSVGGRSLQCARRVLLGQGQDWGVGNSWTGHNAQARPSLPLPRAVPDHRESDPALTRDGTAS